MTLLEAWVQGAWAKAIGATLLHSLWEGAAAALALLLVLSIARSSRVRYAAACLAMVLLVAGCAATFYRLMPRNGEGILDARIPRAVSPAPGDESRSAAGAWQMAELLPWLAPLWLAGVALFQLRCLASWMAAARLRRVGVCGAPEEWAAKLDLLRARLQVTRPVMLLESCLAEVPAVIGHLRPVILVPVGLFTGLPTGQMEAILLHELAHISRADYLVNLMHTMAEGLLFYHPAVWWISSMIRAEREHCCDDLVVATSGDAHVYASALTALAANRWSGSEAALAATGGNLANRIRRILAQPEGPRRAVAPILSAALLIATCGVALGAWQTPASPALAQQTLLAQSETGAANYQKWLAEVGYIIRADERKEFQALRADAARDQFIENFWKRRDPRKEQNAENEFKKEYYRRIAYANQRFGTNTLAGWKTDRGRIYITYGPPDEIDSHPAGRAQGGEAAYPLEHWRYRLIEGVGTNVMMDFIDKAGNGEYKMTTDPSPQKARYVPKVAPAAFRPFHARQYRILMTRGQAAPAWSTSP